MSKGWTWVRTEGLQSAGKFRPMASVLATLVVIVWLAFELFAPTLEKTFDPSQITQKGGNRYDATLALRRWERVYSLPSDSEASHERSNLELYEDGVPLGPSHMLHTFVQDLGAGRYSHWGSGVAFSTSDNTDPTTNGRAYSIKVKLEPHLALRIAGMLGLLTGAFLALAGVLARASSVRDDVVDRSTPTPLLEKVALVASGLVFLAWIALEAAAPTLTNRLDPAAIDHGGGNRYSASVAGTWMGGIYIFPADTGASPARSRLLLYEDGRRLGPRHSLHQEIQQIGKGRYSHWRDKITFASSDNSDAAQNGRAYTILAKLEPNFFVRVAGWLSLLVLAFTAIRFFSRTLTPAQLANRSAAVMFDGGVAAVAPRWALAIAATVFAAVPIIAYCHMLDTGFSSGITLGGYFPISDASGYWGCANEYLEYGQADVWCHRRPLYSMLLASVTLLSGRSLEIVLIMQAGLIGLCTFVFAKEVARWLGALPAVLASYVIFQFVWRNALGVTMTEVGGLCVGLIAAALLLRAAERKALVLAVLGAFMFGLGENMRPGALFALPLLVLWIATLKGFDIRNMIIGGLTAGVAIAASFGVHSLYVLVVGGDPANSFSNTAMTIYGLAFGGDWNMLVADHPELLNETRESTQEIYRLAFDQMRANPGIFLQGIVDNVELHMTQQWANLAFPLVPVVLLYLSGFAAAVIAAWRSSQARLICVMLIGELASAALIERDGGLRLWAVDGALAHALPPMLILSVAARFVLDRVLGTKAAAAAKESAGMPLPFSARAAATACLLIVFPVISAMFASGQVRTVSSSSCAPGLEANIIDLDEVAMMTVSDAYLMPMSFPRRIATDDILSSLGESGWYRDSIEPLNDVRLIRGVTDAPENIFAPGFYISADTPAPASGRILACVDPRQVIEVAVAPFSRIVSATAASD